MDECTEVYKERKQIEAEYRGAVMIITVRRALLGRVYGDLSNRLHADAFNTHSGCNVNCGFEISFNRGVIPTQAGGVGMSGSRAELPWLLTQQTRNDDEGRCSIFPQKASNSFI